MNHAWQYFTQNQSEILSWLRTTVWLAVVPVGVGLALSLPIGWMASRYRWSYSPVVTLGGVLYTILLIVLFLALPGIIGTDILDPLNVAIALTVYCIALLVRAVADGLRRLIPSPLRPRRPWDIRTRQGLLAVQLPLAVPVIGAGLRVATVSNVSLVAVASTLGVSQLGSLFKIGNTRRYRPDLGGAGDVHSLGARSRCAHTVGPPAGDPWQRAVPR